MRTTIDLPDDLFREAKTRAVKQGTTFKNLVTQWIRAGLRAPSNGEADFALSRRPAPPVAILRHSGKAPLPGMTNRQLNALLENEEIQSVRTIEDSDQPKP